MPKLDVIQKRPPITIECNELNQSPCRKCFLQACDINTTTEGHNTIFLYIL